MTTSQLPTEICAAVHQDALNRVPDFFNVSLRDILNEMLQNARRSGVSKVTVTTSTGNSTIAVSDDGEGIADPNAILNFGLKASDRMTPDITGEK